MSAPARARRPKSRVAASLQATRQQPSSPNAAAAAHPTAAARPPQAWAARPMTKAVSKVWTHSNRSGWTLVKS